MNYCRAGIFLLSLLTLAVVEEVGIVVRPAPLILLAAVPLSMPMALSPEYLVRRGLRRNISV